MKQRFGVNLEKKRTLVEGRLTTPMQQAGFNNFHDYIEDILHDKSGAKLEKLVSILTTNYTYFMREDTHYRFMTGVALPEWCAKIKNKDLRTWSAGCSSGAEAYTTAMVINEYLGIEKSQWETTILATDISTRVLNEAKTGEYPEEYLRNLPNGWQKKYFENAGPERWRVNGLIKKQVHFAEFNLMDDFHRFRKPFHIIFCRNVMIYFDVNTKQDLARKFYDALEPGGYFFIGMSETLSGISNSFTQISPAIYRKGRT